LASKSIRKQQPGSRYPRSLWVFVWLLCFAVSLSQVEAQDKETAGQPYLILISLDGFRWDYIDRHPTPAIHELIARGVKADALIPVFPTLTFPNHYTIATGLYPSRHGIIANQFRSKDSGEWYSHKQKSTAQDGSWYRGEPIWVAAEKAGIRTASFYFVGTEAEIQGVRPTDWRSYDKSVDGMKRVRQALKWLKSSPEKRPHLITLYFEDVDDYAHWYGPDSEENAEAIARVDTYIQALLAGIDKLPFANQVNIVLVSDHGQASYDPDAPVLVLDELLDLSGTTFVDGGPYVFIYLDKPDVQRAEAIRDDINSVWNCGTAYLPEDTPPGWKLAGNPDFADVLVIADPGCGVLSSIKNSKKLTPGDHGWAPETPEMRGIFIAAGPKLPRGVEIEAVQSVDLYPLLMNLLDLEPDPDVDSQADELLKLLE